MMDMYLLKIDDLGKRIIIESLAAQQKLLQNQILLGDNRKEVLDMYENVSQLTRAILYKQPLKKEEDNPLPKSPIPEYPN